MRFPLIYRFFAPVTLIVFAVTSCNFFAMPEPPAPVITPAPTPVPPAPKTPAYYGVWTTEEEDGIRKEIEIQDYFIERYYSAGSLQTSNQYRYETRIWYAYFDNDHGITSYSSFQISGSYAVEFEITDEGLKLGGGDIVYSRESGSNNDIKGEWKYSSDDYTLLITFVPYVYENQGLMIIDCKFPNGRFGAYRSYTIKNNILGMGGDEFNNRIILSIIDKKEMLIANTFLTNEQIKKYNDAHTDDAIQSEMFGYFFNINDHDNNMNKRIRIAEYFSEKYYKK